MIPKGFLIRVTRNAGDRVMLETALPPVVERMSYMIPTKQQPVRFYSFFVVAVFLFLLICSCSGTAPPLAGPMIFTDVDFAVSPYKHLTNGGITSENTMPYNIDVITGATVTVEGPGLVTSIPLSMRELENRNEGLVRGSYVDAKGQFIYEGLDLNYLLHNMVDGDNGIILTESAYRVVIKDANRADVASFAVAEVIKAHNDGRPILLAYGIGTIDGGAAAPFVFDSANKDEKSEGYIDKLDNEDGCLKLVYDLNSYGDNAEYKTFSNVAYIYLQEETEPGFKRTASKAGAYNSSRYTDYIIAFRGAALGREMNFTVRQLEDLVAYDENGDFVKGGVGYSDFYSLANNAYWYVNEYEGLDLYKLLLYLGMDDAEAMGRAAARTTLISFIANDGVASQESFSVDTLSYPDAFGFYNKNALDAGDGSYKPSNTDLVETGYPVLLAYGVNNYPYTIAKGDNGYLSGLSNSGGPIRVVFGKTQYNHANGSNQVQYLKDVIVGEDVLYNTHKYTDVSEHKALMGVPGVQDENGLAVNITGDSGQPIIEKFFSVGEVEDLIYDKSIAPNVKKAASIKDFYQVEKSGSYYNDIYEGVSLEYFLMEVLSLPGTTGTISFSNGVDEATLNLDAVFREGCNTELRRDGMKALLAFAKNGAPMVRDKNSYGYISGIALNPSLENEPREYIVKNDGGPLAIIIPSSDMDNPNGISIMNVNSINIELIPDSYAHINAPYSSLASNTVKFFGDGLERDANYSVFDIESKQTKVKTLDYSILNNKGEFFEARYRGIAVYDILTEIGIKNNAEEIIVYAGDGTAVAFPLVNIKKQTYLNHIAPEKQELFAMLAFGTGEVGSDTKLGMPLVRAEGDEGYSQSMKNDGGPLKLVMPQEDASAVNAALIVKDVVAIEVTANEIDTWGHRMGGIYEEFLDYEFNFTVRNDDSEWSRIFTVGELELMSDLVVRDTYTVLDIGECEGIDIWKFVKKIAGSIEGIDDPVSVTVYAEDGYKNDLLSVFYKEGLELGVASELGERKALIISYAINGLPLVNDESHEGYTGLASNMGGPLRTVAETVQGACVKYINKLVVTIPGSGPINPSA